MSGDVVLAGGTVVDAAGTRAANVRIGADGRVAAVGAGVAARPGDTRE